MPAWATKLSGLSTSLMVSWPDVLIAWGVLPSRRLATSADSTAASLVPVTVIVTMSLPVPPLLSVAVTVNDRVMLSPAARKSRSTSSTE